MTSDVAAAIGRQWAREEFELVDLGKADCRWGHTWEFALCKVGWSVVDGEPLVVSQHFETLARACTVAAAAEWARLVEATS